MAMRRALRLVIAPIFTYIMDLTRTHRFVVPLCLVTYYILGSILALERLLPIVALTVLIRDGCNSGIDASINSAAMGALAEVNENRANIDEVPATYGRLRLFGSVGWGLMSLMVGIALDLLFKGDMRYIMFMQTSLGAVAVFISIFLIDLSPQLFERVQERRFESTAKDSDTASNTTATSEQWLMSTAMFVANVIMLNITFGMKSTTMFLYMSSLRISNFVLGFSTFLNCAVEAVCFHCHGQISKRLGGELYAFRLSLLANALVMLALANLHLASNPVIPFLLVQGLVGFVFAMYWASAVHLASALAPVGRETSAQGMLAALGWGLGAAIGEISGGIGLRSIGAPAMYTFVAAAQLWVLFAPLIVFYCVRRARNYSSGYDQIEGDRF